MGCIALLAANFGRKNIPLYTLFLAVSVMLLLNPPWVTDIGFQLSVLATLGIILFAKKEKKIVSNPSGSLLARAYSFIEDDLRVTLAAQVFTIPIILFQFHRLSLIAPISNVLIGWLIAPIMITGFVMIGLGLIWLPLAQLVGLVAWVLISTLMTLVDLTALIPFASINW
jgi:competence protein ComEC